MSKPAPVGAIVRILDYPKGVLPDPLAVIVPPKWARNFEVTLLHTMHNGFARILEDKHNSSTLDNGGWWISPRFYEIIPEESVPDDIAALATRVLLDPDFIPFKEQT